MALFPGGFGTLDEAMETLTLVQTGKRNPMPLMLVDEPGGTYWSKWIRFFQDELRASGYISDSDFSLFERVDSVEAAVGGINRFSSRYHSMRYVNGHLVIRLTSALADGHVQKLRERFSDILAPGGTMAPSGPLPVEQEEQELVHLPRLVVDFNRRDFGRLRNLIDAINRF